MWIGEHDDLPTGSATTGPILAIIVIALGMVIARKRPNAIIPVFGLLGPLVPWLAQLSYWQYIGYLSGPDANIGPANVSIDPGVTLAIAVVLSMLSMGAAWHLKRQPSGVVVIAWSAVVGVVFYRLLCIHVEPRVLADYEWDQWCWYWMPPNQMARVITIGIALSVPLLYHCVWLAWPRPSANP